MAKTISEGRKFAYYGGLGVIGLGLLFFVLSMISFTRSAQAGFTGRSFPAGEVVLPGGEVFPVGNSRGSDGPSMLMPIFAIVLIGVGSLMRVVGARGLAGSGVVLDPQRARDELEPYSRMAGGMVKDVLDEADVDLGSRTSDAGPQVVVMLKCRDCGRLNEEDSKFCQECGAAM